MPVTARASSSPASPPAPVDVAVIGAAGSCGRQLVTQLLDEALLARSAHLQLVGHQGGTSEHELHGLAADLRDAFSEQAPHIELVVDPEDVRADIVVMLAGATLPTDPTIVVDRASLASTNAAMFATWAKALAAQPGGPPLVIVQSNPVELGVHTMAEAIGPDRVIGAGAWSDTLRFRREIADELGVPRSRVHAWMLGQHGDRLVPAWSDVRIEGMSATDVSEWVEAVRAGRHLGRLPEEIQAGRSELLGLIADGEVAAAFDRVRRLPPDLRAALKPFLIHYTAGHTTEIMTAHAVADLLRSLLSGASAVRSLQVSLRGEVAGLEGVGAIPVTVSLGGWEPPSELPLEGDEHDALRGAFAAAATAWSTR